EGDDLGPGGQDFDVVRLAEVIGVEIADVAAAQQAGQPAPEGDNRPEGRALAGVGGEGEGAARLEDARGLGEETLQAGGVEVFHRMDRRGGVEGPAGEWQGADVAEREVDLGERGGGEEGRGVEGDDVGTAPVAPKGEAAIARADVEDQPARAERYPAAQPAL